tara:strand:- start:6694 stop:7452 length:759 start_codon:yes stop_codon:yes gene_type:complete
MNKTEINLHGVLADQIGKSQWNLAVNSVGEAIRGIQANTKKLYQQLIENDEKNIKYRVLINKRDFIFDESKDPNSEEGLKSSQLVMKLKSIKTIDIVPVIEGADEDDKSVFAIVVGVMLIAAGVFVPGLGAFAMPLIMGGIGLVAAGIANLLTPEPEFDDFREIEGGGRPSYIFSGPQNTVREGGPVFVGYGRLLIGSHVIQTSLDNFNADAEVTLNNTWGLQGQGSLKYAIPYAQSKLEKRTQEPDWGQNG